MTECWAGRAGHPAPPTNGSQGCPTHSALASLLTVHMRGELTERYMLCPQRPYRPYITSAHPAETVLRLRGRPVAGALSIGSVNANQPGSFRAPYPYRLVSWQLLVRSHGPQDASRLCTNRTIQTTSKNHSTPRPSTFFPTACAVGETAEDL